MKKLIIFIFLILIAGCAFSEKDAARAVGEHQPASYKTGYADGCNSGYRAGGDFFSKFQKDVSRFRKDELYMDGWNDGMVICKGEYESIGQLMKN